MHHFYFIRHAQSEANLAQLMCGGGIDTPLSKNGIHQAKKVLENHLKINNAKAIIHSGMKRTIHTTEIINNALNLPTYSDNSLKEHIVGDWEGKPWSEIAENYINFNDPPSGEPFEKFQRRIHSGIEKAFKSYETPIIVAHGGVWRAFFLAFNIKIAFHPNNVELFFFEFDNKCQKFPWKVSKCLENGTFNMIDIV